jgi:hypothetical protein
MKRKAPAAPSRPKLAGSDFINLAHFLSQLHPSEGADAGLREACASLKAKPPQTCLDESILVSKFMTKGSLAFSKELMETSIGGLFFKRRPEPLLHLRDLLLTASDGHGGTGLKVRGDSAESVFERATGGADPMSVEMMQRAVILWAFHMDAPRTLLWQQLVAPGGPLHLPAVPALGALLLFISVACVVRERWQDVKEVDKWYVQLQAADTTACVCAQCRQLGNHIQSPTNLAPQRYAYLQESVQSCLHN